MIIKFTDHTRNEIHINPDMVVEFFEGANYCEVMTVNGCYQFPKTLNNLVEMGRLIKYFTNRELRKDIDNRSEFENRKRREFTVFLKWVRDTLSVSDADMDGNRHTLNLLIDYLKD